jgi:hypothetical protein
MGRQIRYAVAFLCTLSLGLTFLLALRQPAKFEQHPIWTSEEDPASRPYPTRLGRVARPL